VRANSAKQNRPLRQKVAEAEAEIDRINGIIAKIDTALALPDIFSREPTKAAQLSKARSAAAEALQRAEDDWLQASASLEAASG
jgi:ATP-binding cassette subfamily F protein 3